MSKENTADKSQMLKIALLGCGNISKVHILAIKKYRYARLVAVCDYNEIRVKELGERENVRYYTDVKTMLEETKPDIVHILTPPQTHAGIAKTVLGQGSHVFIEKPLCLTVNEADSIFTEAEKLGKYVGIDHTFIWSPFVQKAKKIIETGKLGDITHINYVIGDDYLEALKGGYSRWALQLKGGIFFDLLPHPLYLLKYFIPDIKLNSVAGKKKSGNLYHELAVNFSGENSTASLYMSLRQRPLENSLRIYLTKGTVQIDLRNFYVSILPEKGLPGPVARIINTFSESKQRVVGVVDTFVKLLSGRFNPGCGTIGAIHSFYDSIISGIEPKISKTDSSYIVKLNQEIWEVLEPGYKENVNKSEKKKTLANKPDVLVTGGSGFIGKYLVESLLKNGRKVRVMCRENSILDNISQSDIEIVTGNVSSKADVRRAMEGISEVYHLAATMNGDWAEHYCGTVKGTENILESAVECGVKKLTYVSSMGVLDSTKYFSNKPIDENYPQERFPEKRGYYSRAKLQAERIVRQYLSSDKLHVCIIRPGLVYSDETTKLISDAGVMIGYKLCLVFGLGRKRLALTHVQNLIDALVLAGSNENSKGNIYNIVDDYQPSVREYINLFKKRHNESFVSVYIPVALWLIGFWILDLLSRYQKGLSSHLMYKLLSISKNPYFDTSKAKEQLNWHPKISFIKE